ncbi:MAG: hypothetical protein ACKOTD_08900, partial [Phycisphaerales bacterium]
GSAVPPAGPASRRSAATPAATLALVGELHRRGAAWDPARVAPIATGDDPVAAGVAALLLLAGPAGGAADPAPWQRFLERTAAMPAEQRTGVMRAAIEASLLFEIKPAASDLLAACGGAGSPDALRVPAVGMALRIDTPRGLEAWRTRVREERSQVALVRAGMQLLSAIDRGVPAGDCDAIRNGSPVIDAIADAGKAIAAGQDEVAALVTLLDAGHSASAEWALVRAAEMPPERSAPVWRHLLGKIDAGNPDERPAATIVSGVVRELAKTDPTSVEALGRTRQDHAGEALAHARQRAAPAARDRGCGRGVALPEPEHQGRFEEVVAIDARAERLDGRGVGLRQFAHHARHDRGGGAFVGVPGVDLAQEVPPDGRAALGR